VLTVSVSAFAVLYDGAEQSVGIQTENPVSDNSLLLAGDIVNMPEREFAGVMSDNEITREMITDANKVEFFTETRTEEVPFEVIDCPVQTIPKGTRVVTQTGVPGKCENTYIVKYVGGKKTDEVLYSSKALEMPTEEIANVGVGGTVTAKDGTVYNFSYYKQMEATAYTYVPGKTTMTTATGRRLQKGIVAVDPKVIPLHTKMYIASDTFEYGYG
jgi:3D (Asp-Asp-Asp) domain-containing protein